jgi:hypothetical protein
MFLLSVRQFDAAAVLRLEQILPMLHGENWVIPTPVEGFMMNFCPASQVLALSGQQDGEEASTGQVELVQSWTAPKVCPDSWANTCHSVVVLTTTLVPATVSLLPCPSELVPDP